MPNQQLVDYIVGQLGSGVTKDTVYRAVISSGWSEKDVVDAFVAVEKKGTTLLPQMPPAPAAAAPAAVPVAAPIVAPAMPMAAPAAPVAPAHTIPAAAPITPTAPATATPPVAAAPVAVPIAMERAPITASMPKRSLMGLYVGGGVLILLLLMAGGVYMFMPQIFTLLQPTSQPSAEQSAPEPAKPVANVPKEEAATTTLGGSIYTQTQAQANPLKGVSGTVNPFATSSTNPFAQ